MVGNTLVLKKEKHSGKRYKNTLRPGGVGFKETVTWLFVIN